MAISIVGTGTAANSTGNPPVVLPAGIQANDLIVIYVGSKPDAGTAASAPGFTTLLSATGGTGVQGIDTGLMRAGILYKIADGSESGTTVTVTVPSNNVSMAIAQVFRNALGGWALTAVSGNDTTTGTGFSATCGAWPSATAVGDYLLAHLAIPTDSGTGVTGQSLTQSGVTFGTATHNGNEETATGQDMAMTQSVYPITAGANTNAPTYAVTFSSATVAAGPLVVARLREATPPPPPVIQTDPSSPAAVSGTGTTATTASFTPAANSLIVALAAAGGGAAVATVPVTDSLGSTWTLLKRANTNNFAGTTEIWVMDAGASPAARTVTATITGSTGVGVGLTVKVLTGAKPAATCLGGFTVTPSTTAYSISVTTTTADSLACGVLVDSTGAGTLTANGITTAWQTVSDSGNGHKYGTFRATNPTTTPGATTIGFSNTAANNQSITAVEILPAAGSSAITLADTGSGDDAPTVTSTTPLTETGASTDAATVTAAIPVADAGSGSDSILVAFGIALADSGAGTDSLAATVAVPLAETGSATDTPATTAAVPLTQSASATDAIAVTAPISLADSATGSDAVTVGFGIGLSDTGSGADALAVTLTAPLTEAGSAVDAVVVTAAAALADAGTASEARTVAVSLTIAEAGASAETIAAGVPISVSDAGTATDALTPTSVGVTLADTGTAGDLGGANAAVPLTQAASATDALSVAVPVALTDAGAAADAVSTLRTIALADSGAGTDTVTAQQQTSSQITLTDTGSGSERLRVRLHRPFNGVTPRPVGSPATTARSSGGTTTRPTGTPQKTTRPYSGVTSY